MGNNFAVIVEAQLSQQARLPPGVMLRRLDDQTGLRTRRNYFKFQLIGQLQARLSRKAQQLGKKQIAFIARNRQHRL